MFSNQQLSLSNTLFFGSNNLELKTIVEEWCQRNNKDFYFGEANSPDLIVYNSFAVVVDPEFVGQRNLDSFREFQEGAQFDDSIYDDEELVEFHKDYFDLNENGKFDNYVTELLLTNELTGDEIISKLNDLLPLMIKD